MRPLLLLAAAALAASPAAAAAHTVDSAGGYRFEIGWLNEPVTSEPNGIELYVSPLEPGTDPEDAEFEAGVPGLEGDLKVQLLLGNHTVTLLPEPNHNTPGAYYALMTPTRPGYYQANLLGSVGGAPISLSLHLPVVGDASGVLFPPPEPEPEPEPAGPGPAARADEPPPAAAAALALAAAAAAASAVALVRTRRRPG